MPPRKKARKTVSSTARTRTPTRTSRRISGADYLDTEAQASGNDEADEEEADDEQSAGEASPEQSSFLDDRSSVEGDSHAAHLAIDSSLRAQQEQSSSASGRPTGQTPSTSGHTPGLVTPYFPAGLARTPEEPTVFNFGLFVFDYLRLPRGLFPDDRETAVTFGDLKECREYCEAYVTEREAQCKDRAGPSDRTQQREATLSKPEMFRQAGRPLNEKMSTGNDLFDSRLDDLRLDNFGNVMHLCAPFWSDISAQFMHGFPRRLIRDSHGGVLPGNITVAARISNQAVRSLSIGDIAGFTSRSMIEGLGLSTAELMLARSSAIKYAGKRDKPARLVELMVRFGMNFLTLEPLTTEHLQDLRTTSTNHWSRVLQSLPQPPGDESGSSSEEESQLRVSWDTRDELRALPGGPDSEEHHTAVRRHFNRLVQRFVTRTIVTEAEVVLGTETVQRRPSGTSGYHRRRKQPTPRRAIPSASRDTSNPAVSGQEQAEQATPPAAAVVAPDERRNPREVLIALPGIKATTIPSEVSLNRLEHFLRDNQPCNSGPVAAAEAEARQNTAIQSYQRVREAAVRAKVCDLWTASKSECTCIGEAVVRPSPGDADQNCPYCLCDERGGQIDQVTERCENEECTPCMLMNKLDRPTLIGLGLKRNERLTATLEIAPSIARCLNSGELPNERRAQFVDAFSELLSCGKTKVRFVSNVGFLCMVCPNLKHLQLERGWGDVWAQLSKIGSAIGYHTSHQGQLAALIFLVRRCVRGADNKWRWYLQPGDTGEEQRILREDFAGCYDETG